MRGWYDAGGGVSDSTFLFLLDERETFNSNSTFILLWGGRGLDQNGRLPCRAVLRYEQHLCHAVREGGGGGGLSHSTLHSFDCGVSVSRSVQCGRLPRRTVLRYDVPMFDRLRGRESGGRFHPSSTVLAQVRLDDVKARSNNICQYINRHHVVQSAASIVCTYLVLASRAGRAVLLSRAQCMGRARSPVRLPGRRRSRACPVVGRATPRRNATQRNATQNEGTGEAEDNEGVSLRPPRRIESIAGHLHRRSCMYAPTMRAVW